MPIYQLSNAQKKDLLINGAVVKIALPIPCNSDPEDRGDPLDWARPQLPLDVRAFATEAYCTLLPVMPYHMGPRTTLTELLGAIVDGPTDRDRYTVAIDACVVTLTPPTVRRGRPRIQWPVNVVHGGKLLIERQDKPE